MKIFEKNEIVELRPDKWPVATQGETLHKEDVPYLHKIIDEAKKYYQRPKDFLLAWERMLAMKSSSAGLPADSSLTLPEALYLLFLEVSYDYTREHFSAFVEILKS